VRSPAAISWTYYAATLGRGAPTEQLESDVALVGYDAAINAFEFRVQGALCGDGGGGGVEEEGGADDFADGGGGGDGDDL